METAICELLAREIHSLYSAENQLVLALPRMAGSANNVLLASALFAHLDETRQQVARLEHVATTLAIPLGSHWCKTMEAVLAEGTELLGVGGRPGLQDIRLLLFSQRVEHYEIARYRTAILLAEESQQIGVADLLWESLWETNGAEQSYRELTEMFLAQSSMAPGVHAMA